MDAASIAKGLKAKRMGRYWMALCPAHRDTNLSLAISEGHSGVVVHCHAGCDQRMVISSLQSLGLWPNKDKLITKPRPNQKKLIELTDLTRTEHSLKLWYEAQLWQGTMVEAYLRNRGIEITVQENLRFHPALKHPSGVNLPGMLALVVTPVGDVPICVHRTFLSPHATKAEVEPNKMLLGPAKGGVVKLLPYSGALLVGEGIETCLSAMQIYGHSAWAAISAPNLKTLCLPSDVRNVAVLVDRDPPGEEAAAEAVVRWRKDRFVAAWYPPNGGGDFNDALAAT